MKNRIFGIVMVTLILPANAIKAQDSTIISCNPKPAFSPQQATLLKNDLPGNHEFKFDAFIQKVDVEIKFQSPVWLGRVSLISSTKPERNIDRAELAIQLVAGRDFIEVDPIAGLGSGKGTTQVSGIVGKRVGALRITLRPPFIEVPMVLHHIEMETFNTRPANWPAETALATGAPISGGHVSLGGNKTQGGFFFRDFTTTAETKTLTVNCRVKTGGDINLAAWNLLTQKTSGSDAACRIGIKGEGNILYAALYQGKDVVKLCELPPDRWTDVQLAIDIEKNTFMCSFNGRKFDNDGEGWPLSEAKKVNRVFFSVQPGFEGAQLDDVEVNFGDSAHYRFNNATDYNSWQKTGITEWIPPENQFTPEDISQCVTIVNDGIDVRFSKKSGEIMAAFQLPSRRQLINAVISSTMIQTPKTEMVVAGDKDTVEQFEQITPEQIEFTCRFSGDPDVVIKKQYTLTSGIVSKRVCYKRKRKSDGKSFVFLTPAERVYLPKDNLSDLIFAGGDPWYGPRVFAKNIKGKSRQRGAGNSHGAMVMDTTGKNSSFAIVRYKVNERFVFPTSSAYSHETWNVLDYFPDGMQIPMATLSLNGEDTAGYEALLMFFPGDELEFGRRYRALPEVAKRYETIKRPAWLNTAIAQIWLRPELKNDAVNHLKQFLAMTERGEVMVVLNQPFQWGCFGETPRFQNIWGAWVTDIEYQQLIAELKSLSPRVKIALYSWIWTVAPEVNFYKKHPEYHISTDREGNLFNAWPGLELTHLRRLSHPDGYKALAEQYRQFAEKYAVDYFYLDGGMGGAGVIDWKSGAVDQDYHWQDFYEFMRKLADAYTQGQGGLCFNNKNNPIADSGIAEMALDAFRTDAAYITARIWGGKMQESFDPGHRIIPCYWGKSDPWYSSVCMGLGMLPHVECAGLSSIEPDFILRKAPLLTAMREMFDARPVRVIPGSALEVPGSDIIGFEMSRGSTHILSAILDAAQSGKRSFALPNENLQDTPLYVWLNHLVDPSEIQSFSEAQQINAYERQGWILSKVILSCFSGAYRPGEKLEFPLQPRLLTIGAISPSRAVVMAVNGLPTQNKFADTLQINLATHDIGNDITVTVTAPNGTATVDFAVALPKGKQIAAIRGGEYRGAFVSGGSVFVLLRTAEKNVSLQLVPVAPRENARVSMNAHATPGESIAYEISVGQLGKFAAFTVHQDMHLTAVIPISSANGSFIIPEFARNGKYQISLVTTGGATALWQGILDITGEKVVPLPRVVRFTRPSAHTEKVSHPQINQIGLGGRQKERVDLATMTLTAGNLEIPESFSGYSCAGVEFKKARHLKLAVQSDIATRYCIQSQFFKESFAGLIVDYKVNDKYTKRIALNFGINKFVGVEPSYGKAGKPDEEIMVADWIKKKTTGEIIIDLGRWAPTQWNGLCFVSAMTFALFPGRTLSVRVIDAAWEDPHWKPDDTVPSEAAITPFPESIPVRRANVAIKLTGRGDDPVWKQAGSSAERTATKNRREYGITPLGRVFPSSVIMRRENSAKLYLNKGC